MRDQFTKQLDYGVWNPAPAANRAHAARVATLPAWRRTLRTAVGTIGTYGVLAASYAIPVALAVKYIAGH